jgi:Zn-dependent protease/CBS domain-containing protein
MFGRGIKLFNLFGFAIRVDLSWLILATLVAWSLARGLFPYYYPGLGLSTYWWMGIAGALGLFISIIFHEFWHSIIARKYGLPISGITLFIFGGVSEMTDEPQEPKTEFLMAIAGPLSSFFLGGVFFLVAAVQGGLWPPPVRGVLIYLASINVLLGIFNLLPAFPLDGGRVLRSILWKVKGNLRWATRIASKIGGGFALGMIFMGILSFLSGNLIGGFWWFLIGLFLRNASQMSYRQVLIRRALEGEHVNRFMKPDIVTVRPSTSLEELLNGYVYKHHFKMYPVVEEERLVGVVTLAQMKEVPREEWAMRTVGEVAERCTESNTIDPDADAVRALERMGQNRNSRLMVVERGKLVGILALKDMLDFLSIKLDLEPAQ